MKKIKWGILGCGKIARKFAVDLKLVEGAECFAVASTDGSRAKHFAAEFGFQHSFDSYQKLCDFPVNVIYIATPHGLHHDHVMMCLQHQKSVLCEKAFALNSHQLKEMVAESRSRGIFLMEAFWTRFLPQYVRLTEIIDSGQIGNICTISADFGFKMADPPAPRLYDPLLGGGALLDIGIYPVFLAVNLLGRPSEINALMVPFTTGVDQQIVANMRFENGALANLQATFLSDTPVEAVINGTIGRIRITNRFHNASSRIFLSVNGSAEEEINVHRESGYGYQFEARHVQACLEKGLTESPVWSLNHSMLLMETLDRIRVSSGIRYPQLEG